jgi:hypothetical protein
MIMPGAPISALTWRCRWTGGTRLIYFDPIQTVMPRQAMGKDPEGNVSMVSHDG